MIKIVSEGRGIDTIIAGKGALSVLSAERLKILEAIAQDAKSPSRIAKELRMRLQTAYYHVRLLQSEGLLQVEAQEGAAAKKYRAASPSLSVIIDAKKWKPFSFERQKTPEYLKPFISSGFLDAKIVVGSPDPHGKYRARGSELCSAELAMHLGAYASFEYPLYYLDTEAREGVRKHNLFLLGGPKVNTLVEEANQGLPIHFDERTFAVHSSLSGKKYGENVGVLETAESPFHHGKKIFVVAGLNHLATRVAVLAMLKERKKLEQNNLFDSSVFAKVVQGFDEDGDGIVDAVEILE